MRALWKIVWSAPEPAHGDENRRPLPKATQRLLEARGARRDATGLRTCTKIVRTFFEGISVCTNIPGSRLICCYGDALTTVAEAGGPDAT